MIYIAIPTINGEISGEPIFLEENEVFDYFYNNEAFICMIDTNKKTVEEIKSFSI